MVNWSLCNLRNISSTAARGQSQPKAMASLKSNTSVRLSGFSKSVRFSFSFASHIARRWLSVVMPHITSRCFFTWSAMAVSSAVIFSLVSLGNWMSRRGFIPVPTALYASAIWLRLSKAALIRLALSSNSSLKFSSISRLSTTSFLIISAAITSWRYTVTFSFGLAVLGVAEMRISTAGLILSSTAADLSAVFVQNICSSSMMATMGNPNSSFVLSVIS